MNFWRSEKIGWQSAAAIVVANMVGTGVFTTLGLQLGVVHNTWSILFLWILGAVISLLGAFSYAEVGTHLPSSGGEYHFLSTTIHPSVGYLSGWVSMTVGFAAPIALAAMAMGAYLEGALNMSSDLIALIAIIFISFIHSFNLKRSSRFQDVLTVVKVLLLLCMVTVGFLGDEPQGTLDWSDGWQNEIWTSGYAVALIFVTYTYSGWNAAAYIVGEIRKPEKNLPIALIGGTLVVSILYVLLQLVLLRQAPISALQGKVEIGQIAAALMFGPEGGKWVSFLIGFLLISSISAMIWVGPRVSRAMSNDYRIWKFLEKDNKQGIPVRAIWFQSAISILLILTGSFEEVLIYSGFLLQLFTAISVGSIFILRKKSATKPYFRSPAYPWFQIIYIGISIWIMVFTIADEPYSSFIGCVNLLLGLLTYWWSIRKSRSLPEKEVSEKAVRLEEAITTD